MVFRLFDRKTETTKQNQRNVSKTKGTNQKLEQYLKIDSYTYMKEIKILIIGAFVFALTSCGSKTATAIAEEVIEETPVVEAPAEALTPCTTLSQLNSGDRDEAETAFVLYRDFVKAGDMAKALPLWQKAYQLAPGANGRIQYHFDDGVKIYTDLFKKAQDKMQKQAYVDTVMMIYDKRVECFGNEATIKGRKAFDYYYNFHEYSDADKTFNLFKEAVESKGKEADYFVVNPFSSLLHDRVVDGKISKEEGSKLAVTLDSAIAHGLATCGNKCEAWNIIADYAPNRLESLEGVDDFYDCDYYSNKYYTQFLESPADCEVIELAYRRMLRGKCDINDPRLVEVKAAKDKNCFTPPPPPGLLKQAFDLYSTGDYKGAIVLFEKFIDQTTDVEKKAKYTLLIAKIYYGDIKNFSSARKYARDAANMKSNWGEPYILIGKLYASSGPLCGPGRGWDSQIVTWPAIDKFQYAKKIDPSVAGEANKWINTYSQYMPSREDIFQRGIKEGSAFKVGCWINESTTVRVK